MDMKALMKEWRIWVLGITLLISLGFLVNYNLNANNSQEANITTNINKGLDLSGGTQMLLGVEGENITKTDVDRIKNKLQVRISAFGLTETSIRTVRLGDNYKIQIEVANTNQTRLRKLVTQKGSFEARMPIPVTNEKEFTIDNTYTFRNTDNGVSVNGTTYQVGDRFRLDGATFIYQNNNQSAANIEVVAYSGQEIQKVIRSDAMVRETRTGYTFQFPVLIDKASAERVKKISGNYQTILLGNDNPSPYLGLDSGQPAQLRLYVDETRQSSLNVAASFKTGNIVTQPQISGGGSTADEARDEMKRLQSILESGSLEHPVKVESVSTITASLGGQFLSTAFIAIVLALLAVGGLIFVRYGDPRVAVPIVITGSSEVIILLGMWFSTVATLDLASIAGIIAAVGTGVDDQIIITDESGREKVRSWKKRMKRAFFVIFTSAASTIGAMLPIVSPEMSTLGIGAAGLGLIGYSIQQRGSNPHYIAIGALAIAVSAFSWSMNPSAFALQSVKGFAVTTILGIMVGITITRPAYAQILEHLKN